MLLILVFNMGGYMLLFHYFIKQSDAFANEQISKGLYKPAELVEIKIPTRMPYIQEQKEYEPIAGQIELSGRSYNYVALKLTRDTMYVKCVPNYEKTRLVSQNVISAKEVSDSPLQKKNHPVEKKSGVDNEYNYTVMLYTPGLNGQSFQQSYIYITPQILSTYLTAPAQPPEQGILA
jgi:hypothetical protein